MNFIDNIEIKNFKSIRHQKIEGCKRINVFVGPPNVGKSNILEALGLFTITGNELPFSDFVRMGKPTTLFFNGAIENQIQIILNEFYRAKINYDKEGLLVSMQEIRYTDDDFENVDEEILKSGVLNEADPRDKINIKGGFFIHGSTSKISDLSGYSQLCIYNDLKEDRLTSRDKKNVPILKYEFKKDIKYDSKSAWNLNQPYGENIFEIISTKDELHTSITEILDSYGLNFLYDSELQEYKILKMAGNKFFTVPYFMTADTLRRLIFHKAAVMSNKNSVLLFEEPEANCYEPYIMEITNTIKNDKNNNQFFIITHSQYVIDELMRDEESRNDTNIYLVGLDNNETKIKLLSEEASKYAYQTGLNLFFNYQTLWDEN